MVLLNDETKKVFVLIIWSGLFANMLKIEWKIREQCLFYQIDMLLS